MKDTRLEKISNDINRGIPVRMAEAIEAINYQEGLRADRESKTLLVRLKAWLRNKRS